jgi:hypothetical protein
MILKMKSFMLEAQLKQERACLASLKTLAQTLVMAKN